MPKTTENKSKSNILKIEVNSGSDSDDSEHELSYYMKDKVKLMKEVLKLIKPKKIKSMAPNCIKHLDIVEINSMLLEELLGISNKRLQYIFNGENVDRETSSSDSDEEKKPVDIISLDDISDDDIEVTIHKNDKGQNKRSKLHKSHKIKKECKSHEEIKIDRDLPDTLKDSEKQKLMSVLELLELQARARAIKSQLALEASKQSTQEVVLLKHEDDSDPDAVIIESPKHKQIVLTSDSEDACSIKGDEISVTKDRSDSTTAQNDNVIILEDEFDELHSNNEEPQNSKINNKILDLKKQRLLSKVKKIKLIRNKKLIEKTVDDNDTQQNISETCGESKPCMTTKQTDDMDFINATNVTNQTDITSNEIEDTTKEIGTTTLQEEVKDHEPKNKNHKKGSYSGSEIDNNEIVVINLDEDEMKGIEND